MGEKHSGGGGGGIFFFSVNVGAKIPWFPDSPPLLSSPPSVQGRTHCYQNIIHYGADSLIGGPGTLRKAVGNFRHCPAPRGGKVWRGGGRKMKERMKERRGDSSWELFFFPPFLWGGKRRLVDWREMERQGIIRKSSCSLTLCFIPSSHDPEFVKSVLLIIWNYFMS